MVKNLNDIVDELFKDEHNNYLPNPNIFKGK